ncbi:MAG: hypothetical protein J6Y62_07155 [Clostridia bacterium]|nr:hypothetical protein [Clostridia bacterium]
MEKEIFEKCFTGKEDQAYVEDIKWLVERGIMPRDCETGPVYEGPVTVGGEPFLANAEYRGGRWHVSFQYVNSKTFQFFIFKARVTVSKSSPYRVSAERAEEAFKLGFEEIMQKQAKGGENE